MNAKQITGLPITPDTYKNLARVTAQALDSSLPLKYTFAKGKYTQLLEYTTYRPTLGLLAQQEIFTTKVKDFPKEFAFNLKILKNMPSIKYLTQILDNRIETLYPKTVKARKHIIESDRLQLDEITKSKGYNLLDKIKILFK